MTFIRIAANQLEALTEEFAMEAEYHASAGMNAARGVADSTASWLNGELGLGAKEGNALSLTHNPFLYKVAAKLPKVEEHLRRLAAWAGVFHTQRLKAQHGNGLAMFYGKVLRTDNQDIDEILKGWFLHPADIPGGAFDLKGPRWESTEEFLTLLAPLLRRAANEMEEALEQVIAAIPRHK